MFQKKKKIKNNTNIYLSSFGINPAGSWISCERNLFFYEQNIEIGKCIINNVKEIIPRFALQVAISLKGIARNGVSVIAF